MKRSFVFILILLITMAGGCIFSEDEEAFKVSGTICNTTGSGMESVSVAIEGKINKTTESSSNGTYSFEEIGEGEYKITPFSEDFTFIPESNIFTVTDNDIDGLDFTGTLNTYTVSGTVFDINGTGLSDVCVYLSGSGGNFNTTTVANGDYTFEHIVKGEWTVTIQEDGATFTPEPLPFTISDTDETERNFTITGYSVSGTILDSQGNGLEGITVQISGSGGNYNAVTDTNGMYTFNDVSNGEWTLTPMHDVYSFLPESLTFTVSGSKLTGKDFTLTAFSVSGTILDSNSNALEGVTVTLSGTGGDYTTTTDSNGDYTFENIMTGEWTLTPEKNNYSFLPVSLAVTVSSIDVSDKNFIGTFLDYFPISDGAYWIYDYTFKLFNSPTETGTRTVSISGTQEINGKDYWINMEDDELAGIYTRVENDIVYSYIYSEDTVKLFGTDIPIDSELLSFDLSLEPGTTWEILEFEFSQEEDCIITGEYVGKEDVTVPAGTFEGCKKYTITTVLDTGIFTTNINVTNYWLAPNVGMVKNTQAVTALWEHSDREEVLNEYNIP